MVNTRVTQVPVLVIELSNQPARITQIPILVVTREAQPLNVTQVPLLVPITPKPLPEPLPLLPEVGIKETWEWLTAVNIKERGNEQRASLREKPRVSMTFDAVLLNNEDWRTAYQNLHRRIDREFLYPLYQYWAPLTQDSASGTAKLYFNPANTDLRAGAVAALFDPQTEETFFVTVDTVDADGATLSENLEFDAFEGWAVSPVRSWRLANSSIKMDSVDGVVSMSVESMDYPAFLRPGSTASLTTIDGIPIITRRPNMSSDFIPQKGVEWMDSQTSTPAHFTRWRNTYFTSRSTFTFNRMQDMDYWRLFADTVRGRAGIFILPTWRNDLPLVSLPALGATQITTSNVRFAEYRHHGAYRYIQIHSANGVKYRRVLDSVTNYDSNGDAESVTMVLASSIGSVPGDNSISAVSFANVCRLNNDKIDLRHFELDTQIELDVRTVDA